MSRAVLSDALRFVARRVCFIALDDQLADKNPAAGVEHFEIPAALPRVLSFDKEEQLMPELAEGGPYLLPFVTLAPGTGMREA